MCLRRWCKALSAFTGIFLFMTTTVFAGSFLVKLGMQGENVRQVQQLLEEQGYSPGNVDGVCGPATIKAIKRFQGDNNLVVDGIVGEDTYKYLLRGKTEPNRGNAHGRALYLDASAYSAFDPGNGAHTSTGRLVKKGVVAVDPDIIPLGTKLYIPGYGDAVAADVGSGIRGNRIDIAFDTHEEALSFGRQSVTVFVLET